MSVIPESLRTAVETWIAEDPDPSTREELRSLLEGGERAELEERFQGPLAFGTAGLRGLLGGGPHRMNRAVVLRTTAGLCAWLLEQIPDAAARGICVGYDGRRMSAELADDVASVVSGAGIVARVFTDFAPTPLVGFSLLERGAAAAVVITASHNPPEYNGYKVFWANGAQIIPPHDEGIAARIAAVGPLEKIPRCSTEEASERGLREELGASMQRHYLDYVGSLATHRERPEGFGIAYTAMHGVGAPYVLRALEEARFARIASVPSQEQPDGTFPTVAFPNPEEAGALDLVLALARAEDAELVLANDPDADRLAVAVRDAAGEYVQLNGNELGALMGHFLLERASASSAGASDARQPLVLCTIVSSPMLEAIAAAHGARFEQTLTGHKWIHNRAMQLEAESDVRFVFGYEEALGYAPGSAVRDKDGIASAILVADMAAYHRAQGQSLLEVLEEAYRRYGLFLSRQVSKVLPGGEGAAQIAASMRRVRAEPPTEIAGIPVRAFADLQLAQRRLADGRIEAIELPPSDVVSIELEGGHRIMLRPSGTEPKLKYYFDVRLELEPSEPLGAARGRGEALLDRLVASFDS
ncbi:MAG: phospho-sugar mutase [Myxococcales bacterium]|nr:phospho-sugar mutase [Myxococcales bacterium]